MQAFQIISAIPAKSVDWAALRQAMRTLYVECYGDKDPTLALARYDAANGLREVRFEIGCMANMITDKRSKTTNNTFIAPSPETLSWGGFLGGERVITVSQDDGKLAGALAEIQALVLAASKVSA